MSERDIEAFMQARGLAAGALSDMTGVLSGASTGPEAAPYLAISAAMQTIAEAYRKLGFAPKTAEQAMHHGCAVACRGAPVPTNAIWTESPGHGR